jgi:hypothetical protein
MSLYATNASKADATLLDDGVADTLASGNTSASYQPSCFPLEARQRPCRPDRDEYGRQRELCTCVTDQARPERRGKIARF